MSNDPLLKAELRTELGTAVSRRLRSTGQVPGNIYGHKLETLHFSVSVDDIAPIVASGHKVVDFELNGKQEKAIIRDVQKDTFSKHVVHFDLLRVDENERVSTEVELSVRGIAPGVLAGGILEQPHHKLPIECPVIRLPDQIVVRINNLQLGEAIHVKDLILPPDVKTSMPQDEVIVHIVIPKKRGSDEAETEEAAAKS